MIGGYVPFFRPSFDQQEFMALERFLVSLKENSPHAERKKFEKDFLAFIGQQDCIAVRSGTLGLYLILDSLGLQSGDEVIVSNVVCEGVINVIEQLGAKPILLDIEPVHANMNAALLPQKITDRTRAVIAVHYGGVPCDLSSIVKTCRSHNIPLIEDCALALGARYEGQLCGTFGDIALFSFYANKIITAAEGGAVACRAPQWIKRIRSACFSSGETLESTVEYCEPRAKLDFLMGGVSACLGRQQLQKAHSFLAVRKEIFQRYNQAFAGLPDIRIPAYEENISPSFYQYVLELDPQKYLIWQVIESLRQMKVSCFPDFVPIHRKNYYRQKYGLRDDDYKVSDALSHKRLCLPFFPGIQENELAHVIASIYTVLGRPSRYAGNGSERSTP